MAEVQTSTGASAKDSALLMLSIFACCSGSWRSIGIGSGAPLRIGMVLAGFGRRDGLIWFKLVRVEFRQFGRGCSHRAAQGRMAGREETIKTPTGVHFRRVMDCFLGLDWVSPG